MLKKTVLMLATMAMCVGGFAGQAAAASPSTTVTIVKPVDQYQVLKAGWTITHTFYGSSCSGGSEAVVGADRCFSGNNIYDPCWPTMNTHNRYNGSFCPSSAWSRSGILLKGHHGSPDYARGKSSWGLGLASGLRCMTSEGAGDTYKGKRVSYFCEHSRTWLVGRPSRASRTWTILAIRYDKKYRVVAHWTASIAHAWVAVSPYGA